MGKSGGRKKKGNSGSASNHVAVDSNGSNSVPIANGGVDLDSSLFLKRANELKEEGNKRFQSKDFAGALEQYDKALRLTPKNHPDRAVYHSNRAACLMQVKPIDYEAVISECTLALQVQPRYLRALLRRSKAFEAVGKTEMAMQDVQVLLGAEPNNPDALEIARRLKTALGPIPETQQDLQSRPSPAALGASAVRGAPVAGLGPCLPSRAVSKKGTTSTAGSVLSPASTKTDKSQASVTTTENASENKTQMPKLVLKPSSGSTKPSVGDSNKKEGVYSVSASAPVNVPQKEVVIPWRSLKLVYDHDIRLSQMPVNCSFKALREIVGKRFPSSKSVLIKYKDTDGDLVTITNTSELRMAESGVDSLASKEPDSDKSETYGMLRFHIVEVSPEQEPDLVDEEEKEEEEKPVEIDDQDNKEEEEDAALKEDSKAVAVSDTVNETESKEIEIDDWLFEFAQLFRTHVGIDPDAHIDLHEVGMELCTEALEETVTSEDAQKLFEKAAAKFQEVAALAFFNWGNVHMCAARKRIPLDESAGNDVVTAQLQLAYDWVKEKYSLAREKYEEALVVKPDFYEGLLALGQQQFEMAKLHWSFALARKIDLSGWDPAETLQLFDSAEEKMKSATEMWEKLEEQRAKEIKDPGTNLKRKKKQGNDQADGERDTSLSLSPEEAAEQAAVMRSQIHLFWGNMHFERSQVECKLGMGGWKEHMDAAVERFKLAGASDSDISVVLKNHCSNAEEAEGENKVKELDGDELVIKADEEVVNSEQ